MRYLIPTALVLVLSFLGMGCGPTGQVRQEYEYQKVKNVDATAEEIYDRALVWMAERFVSSNYAIQLRDEENRRIVANATADILFDHRMTAAPVEMNLIVEAREGRFRMTARRFEVGRLGNSPDTPLYAKHLPGVNDYLDGLRQQLADYIESGDFNEEW